MQGANPQYIDDLMSAIRNNDITLNDAITGLARPAPTT